MSVSQSLEGQKAGGLSSSWQHVLLPSSSGSSIQQCGAVGRGSAPVLGRRQEKSVGGVGPKQLLI